MPDDNTVAFAIKLQANYERMRKRKSKWIRWIVFGAFSSVTFWSQTIIQFEDPLFSMHGTVALKLKP